MSLDISELERDGIGVSRGRLMALMSVPLKHALPSRFRDCK